MKMKKSVVSLDWSRASLTPVKETVKVWLSNKEIPFKTRPRTFLSLKLRKFAETRDFLKRSKKDVKLCSLTS
jgi:hypothetical protein